MFRMGIRAHDFGRATAEDLADKISQYGFSCIQLAIQKAINGIDQIDGKLSPGFANYLGETFRKKGIQVGVFGCYINPVSPDEATRRKELNRFKECIRYARDLGCSIVGTETGSLNADWSYHPENGGELAFSRLVEALKELVAEAEKFGVIVGMEGVATHTACNPARIKRILDAVNSNNIQIIFDPVNLMTIDNYKDQRKVIDESLSLFGDRIVACHAKDFIIVDGKVKVAPIGEGLLDYEYLMKELLIRKPYLNILLEDTKMDKLEASIAFMSKFNK